MISLDGGGVYNIYIYVYIKNAHAIPPHLDVFRELGAMGRCKDLCALCVWVSGCVGWLLLGWILAPADDFFVTPGWFWASPGLDFEFFVSLWGDPEAPGARHHETNAKVRK